MIANGTDDGALISGQTLSKGDRVTPYPVCGPLPAAACLLQTPESASKQKALLGVCLQLCKLWLHSGPWCHWHLWRALPDRPLQQAVLENFVIGCSR